MQALGGGAKSQRAQLEGGLNFSARDFEKRANLPPPVNFDRSLTMLRFHPETALYEVQGGSIAQPMGERSMHNFLP